MVSGWGGRMYFVYLPDFERYSAVGVQLLDIIVGKAKDWNPKTDKLTWGNESALGDTMGMIMMICGNLDGKIESYKTCVDEKLNLVKGMGDGPATMAFMRGEFQVFRGNPPAYFKKLSKSLFIKSPKVYRASPKELFKILPSKSSHSKSQ